VLQPYRTERLRQKMNPVTGRDDDRDRDHGATLASRSR
jgi:hypothetical protein